MEQEDIHGILTCRFCGKDDFVSRRGLLQHQRTNKICLAAQVDYDPDNAPNIVQAPVAENTIVDTDPISEYEVDPSTNEAWNELADISRGISTVNMNMDDDDDDDDDNGGFFPDNEDEDIGEVVESNEDFSNLFAGEAMAPDPTNNVIDCSFGAEFTPDAPEWALLDYFRKYCKYGKRKFTRFSQAEEFAIKVLHTLYKKGCALDTYEELMRPFLCQFGNIQEDQPLTDSPWYITRQTLMRRLSIRYNVYPQAKFFEAEVLQGAEVSFDKRMPSYFVEKDVTLPASGSEVKVYTLDFAEELMRLLSDPRLDDSDWDFFDNDPLAPPPQEHVILGNMPTGLGYRDTYHVRIRMKGMERKEVLLAIIIYLDETSTAQFADLGYFPVKFSLGNFKPKVCNCFRIHIQPGPVTHPMASF